MRFVVKKSIFDSNVSRFVKNELSQTGTQVISTEADKESHTLRVVAVGREFGEAAIDEAESRMGNYGLDKYRLAIIQGAQSDSILLLNNKLSQISASREEEHRLMQELSQKMGQYESRLAEYTRLETVNSEIASELPILFPTIESISLSRPTGDAGSRQRDIVSAYVERDKWGQYIYASYLQEVKDGEVVFDWWSTDHKDLKTWVDPFFGLERDYVHFNSIQVLPDDNLLVSLRHLSSLLKIDRATGTGDILWRIAGTKLDEEQSFSGQHYATLLDDNTLTIFDNGNGHNPAATRLLRLTVDPETGDVTGGGNILPTDDNSYFTQACGSFALVGNNYVAGWGLPGLPEGPYDRLVTEMDANGKEIFGLRLTGAYQPTFFNSSYRCVKCQ